VPLVAGGRRSFGAGTSGADLALRYRAPMGVLERRDSAVGLMLAALCCMNACGQSERTVNRGARSDAGQSTGGSTGGSTAGSSTGGSAGQAMGGAGVACDYLYCQDGRIGLGACGHDGHNMCDPAVSGVECVASGSVCPNLGGSGGGGIGGAGVGGGSDPCAFPNVCDCPYCVNGQLLYTGCPPPGLGFTLCDLATAGVQCVSPGTTCPRIGEGGASGEGGAP
jgi:hypothetical protein